MLKKEFRLKPGLLRNPKNFNSSYFNIKFGRNDINLSRFAFIVSKKVDSRATERNSAKRKVRSVIEEIFDNIEAGIDFIFYIRADAKTAKREEIAREISKFLKENNLLK